VQTGSADYFTGLRNELTGLTLDFARSKLIDVEHVNDTRNVNDTVDVREGQATGLGLGMTGWLLVGGLVIGGVLLLRKVL
jgi:hypothetical protein